MSNQGYVLTSLVICQSSAVATGNGTAVPVVGWSAISLQVSGTFVGTVTFEGTLDDTNWVSLQGANVADGTVGTTATAAGIYTIPCVGLSQFRARVSAWTSGTITAIACAVTAAPGMTLADIDIQGSEAVVATLTTGELHLGGVGGHTVTPSFTPVLTVAGAYSAGDYVGTSASTSSITAARVNAGSGWVISARLIDYALQSISMECWLFNAAITPPADNAAWTLSDADLAKLVCVIPFSTYYASALNSTSGGVPVAAAAFVCPASVKTLFPYLVTRGTPTYATGDLTVIFSISED